MASTSTWAALCGPSRARILRGFGPGDVQDCLTLRARQARLRALVAAPGATPASRAARACLEADMRTFAAEITALLEANRQAGAFVRLALAAPAPMLGLLRAASAPGLRRCLVAEIEVDLVAAGDAELRRRLGWLIDGPRT